MSMDATRLGKRVNRITLGKLETIFSGYTKKLRSMSDPLELSSVPGQK